MALTRQERAEILGLTRREFVAGGSAAVVALAVHAEAAAQDAPTGAAETIETLVPFALPGVLVLGAECVDCDDFFVVGDAQP